MKTNKLLKIIGHSDAVYSTSSLVKISIPSLISCLTLKMYLTLLVYDRNLFGSSLNASAIFGYPFNLSLFFFVNCSETFRQFLENLWKSSESGRKSSGNRQKRHYQYVCVINKIIHGCL